MKSLLSRLGPPVLLAALILALWELYCHNANASPLILPAPSGIVKALALHRVELLSHASATLSVTLLGFTLSVLFAFCASLAFHRCAWAERAAMPLFIASQTVPLVALAPLMILWFGFGLLPKVILVILVTFLPILMSLLSGYRQVPEAYIELLTAMGATPWQRFRRAVLPAARPSFLAGLRISATYAVVATIFAEYAGARQGLGIFILSAKNNFRADLVLAAVLVSAGLTLALLVLLRALDWLTAPARRLRHA